MQRMLHRHMADDYHQQVALRRLPAARGPQRNLAQREGAGNIHVALWRSAQQALTWQALPSTDMQKLLAKTGCATSRTIDANDAKAVAC